MFGILEFELDKVIRLSVISLEERGVCPMCERKVQRGIMLHILPASLNFVLFQSSTYPMT